MDPPALPSNCAGPGVGLEADPGPFGAPDPPAPPPDPPASPAPLGCEHPPPPPPMATAPKAEELNPELSVYETVDSIAVGEIRKELRNVLGAFLFEGEDVFKKVKVLSGGERTRLALCQLLLSPSNFLILDEPTNHLDIASKEILKKALKSYKGTFVVVSHDREFLQDLTNRIWEIKNHTLKIHHYSVQQFLKEKQSSSQIQIQSKKEDKKNIKKPKKPKINPGKIEKEIRQIEQKISKLEELQKNIQEDLNVLDYSDEEKSKNVISRFENNKKELDLLMEKWEELLSKT